jgi:hypothetical protein
VALIGHVLFAVVAATVERACAWELWAATRLSPRIFCIDILAANEFDVGGSAQ